MVKGKTRLKNLQVEKVDFVDQGANQHADIVLTKRREPQEEGFWKGLISYIKKQMAADPEGAKAAAGEIEKAGAQTFGDKMGQRSLDRIQSEMWDVCYALEGSLISILRDDELDQDGKKEAMEQSAEEFSQAIGGFIVRWSKGTMANVEKRLGSAWEPDAEALETMRDILDHKIEKAKGTRCVSKPEKKPGKDEGDSDMLIDKSKMTPEDAAQFERMAKAYGWVEDRAVQESAAGGGEHVGKGAEPQETTPAANGGAVTAGKQALSAPKTEEDMTKGLHPAVQAELEALRKMRQDMESRELYEVAKRYEAMGKQADELVPVLKSMKAAGDDSYQNYLAVLDEMISMQEASGMFQEIGKSGGHTPVWATSETEAFEKARGKAAEIRKSRPELTEAEAIDLAICESPELQEALM